MEERKRKKGENDGGKDKEEKSRGSRSTVLLILA